MNTETQATSVVTETKPKVLTEMDSGLYRKNVMKTLSVKPAKLGLALASRNTEKTSVMHCVHGLMTEAVELFAAMRPFLLGEQMSKIDKFGADGPQIELGDCGYYLAAGAKVLKAKAFSAKKKVKLAPGATIHSTLLDFLQVVGQLDDLCKKTYYGPKMTQVEKAVRNPTTQEITQKMVPVVDKDAEAKAWEERKAKIVALWPQAQELHACLCFVILGTPTGPVNLANIKKLVLRFPEGTFEMEAAAKKDPEAEAEAAQNAEAPAEHAAA